jgi:cellulose synthase/poly-beta-1,6-N-acetylglucosamine synthase-like glycosyltransferase
MKTIFFLVCAAVTLTWLLFRRKVKPSIDLGSIDVIVPAYNEEKCIVGTVRMLLANRFIGRVIVVNDGSSDGTGPLLDLLAATHHRVIAVHQPNSGKGGAIMNGLAHVSSNYVFLTDADTLVPADSDGLGYLIAELEQGADAVGGIPASNLNGAGLLPHIRATVKIPMIAVKRLFQQLAGGAPFLVSGACGLFRTEVLRAVPFSDRTKVEDLDLTWSLVKAGYTVKQSVRCIVYSQECNSLKAEWLRWRRWIIGYAVCMRLHRDLLPSRFGFFSILPMFLVVVVGVISYAIHFHAARAETEVPLDHLSSLAEIVFPPAWIAIVGLIGSVSAVLHRKAILIALAPAAIVYVFLSYAIWLVHGVNGLITGSEPKRDKPPRYNHVVD